MRFLKLKIAECSGNTIGDATACYKTHAKCTKKTGSDTSKIIMEKQPDCNVTGFEKHFYPKTYKLDYDSSGKQILSGILFTYIPG